MEFFDADRICNSQQYAKKPKPNSPNTFELSIYSENNTFLNHYILLEIGLLDTWNYENKLSVYVNGALQAELTSNSAYDHSLNICSSSPSIPDRRVTLTIDASSIKASPLPLSITAPPDNKFAVFSLYSVYFEVCPSNSKYNLASGQCDCIAGFRKYNYNTYPIWCKIRGYQNRLCTSCVPCPAFCKTCDSNGICITCLENTDLQAGTCVVKNGLCKK